MVTTSSNGWTAGSADYLGIKSYPVPGTGTVLPMVPAASTMLLYVADRFNREVEKLVTGWCWGYSYRVISGSTSLSNHSSGTAIDLNAPNHPLGASGTFSKEQVKTINGIVGACQGAVRWGGSYTSRKDEMHFEIDTSAAEVKRISASLGAGGSTLIPEGSDDSMILLFDNRQAGSLKGRGPFGSTDVALVSGPIFSTYDLADGFTVAALADAIANRHVPATWVMYPQWADIRAKCERLTAA